jgi:hypothetical protein
MVNEGYDDFICWLEIIKKVKVAYGIQEDLAPIGLCQNPSRVSDCVLQNGFGISIETLKNYRFLILFGSLQTTL